MLKHLIQRFVHSMMGNKHYGQGHGHGYGHGNHHYSSSDYKKRGYHRPPQQPHYPPPQQPHYPPQQGPHYGHGHYKRKYSSFSS